MALSMVTSITRRILTKTTINKIRELQAVNAVELPQEIEDRFNYSYPYSDATRRTAKISVSELKRRFQERELEAGTIDTLNEPIITVDTGAKRAVSDAILGQAIKIDPKSSVNVEAKNINPAGLPITEASDVTVSSDELANSVFGRKPQALQSEEGCVDGGSMGYLDA